MKLVTTKSGAYGTLAAGRGFLVTQTGGLLEDAAVAAVEAADQEIDAAFAAWDRELWQEGDPRAVTAAWERLAAADYLERTASHGGSSEGRTGLVAMIRKEARRSLAEIVSAGGPIVGGQRQPAQTRDAGDDSRRIDLRLG